VTASRRSALDLVLLIPERAVEIKDTLVERTAARGNADISARQTRLRPGGLIGALNSIGASCSDSVISFPNKEA